MARERQWDSLVCIVACGLLGLLAASPSRAASGSKNAMESAMAEVAGPLGTQLAESGLRKLAIAEFTDLNGYRSALGPFLADELMQRLFEAQPRVFDFVDQRKLSNSLGGQNTDGPVFDAAGIAAIGKSLGVQAVIVGTLSDLGEEIKVSIRVLATDSAQVAAVAAAKFPREGAAEALLRQKGSSFASAPSHRQIQTSKAFFKNDFLLVTAESISLSSKKDWIHLALAIENLTDQELVLRAAYRAASVTSHAGDKFWSRELEGIVDDWNNKWTTFAPRSRSVIAFSFSAHDRVAKEGYYSFSTTLHRRSSENKYINFSVGIPGIQLSLH